LKSYIDLCGNKAYGRRGLLNRELVCKRGRTSNLIGHVFGQGRS